MKNLLHILIAPLLMLSGASFAQMNILTPHEGELLGALSSYEITWTPGFTSGNVMIMVYDGYQWTVPAESTPDDGSFIWNVPYSISTNCMIRIQDEDGDPWVQGEGNFSILDSFNPCLWDWHVSSQHSGNDRGEENYVLLATVRVADMQGLSDISSVTVTDPDGSVHILSDDGMYQDQVAGDGIYSAYVFVQPPTGEYTFTVTDQENHGVIAADQLDNVIDFPRNISPAHNSFVGGEPVISWDPIPGVEGYNVNIYNITDHVSSWYLATNLNSVVYNSDNQGTPLVEGKIYRLSVTAYVDDATSYNYDNIFIYTNSEGPVGSDPYVSSRHQGNDQGNEQYEIQGHVFARDPQGTSNISSVTIITPDNITYPLYDDGNHDDGLEKDGFYRNMFVLPGVALAGEYKFVITDNQSNTDTVTYVLPYILDYPRNTIPVNEDTLSGIVQFSYDLVPNAQSYYFRMMDNQDQLMWEKYIYNNTTQITYNDDGWGRALLPGQRYHWQVGASGDYGDGWIWPQYFTWMSDSDSPEFANRSLYFGHERYAQGYEYRYVNFYTSVYDNQGNDDIALVKVACPDLTEIILDPVNGRPGEFNYSSYPDHDFASGSYIYSATDKESNTVSDTLQVWVLGLPEIIVPSNNSFVDDVSVFKWNRVNHSSFYSIILRDENYTFTWEKYGVTDTLVYYSGVPLTEGKTYYFEVQAINETGRSSNACMFTFSHETEKPVATSQSVITRNSTEYNGNCHFGQLYQISVKDPQGLSNIKTVTVTTPDAQVYTLLDDGVHSDQMPGDGIFGYNNVQPNEIYGTFTFNVSDQEDHDTTLYFEVTTSLPCPQIIAPVNGSAVSSGNPVFSWNPVEGANYYSVDVYGDDGYMWGIGLSNTSTNQVQYNSDGMGRPLEEGRVYNWRLYASGNNSESYSYPAQFVYRTTNSKLLHVDVNNTSGTENGSAVFPFNTIQEAINASVSNDTLIVHPGIYQENIVLASKNIIVASEFLLNPDPGLIEATIIKPALANTTIEAWNSNSEITGFTIRDAYITEPGQAACYFSNSTMQVTNCYFKENHCWAYDYWSAGALIAYAGETNIKNCKFIQSIGQNGASAIRAGDGTINITNTLFIYNIIAVPLFFSYENGSITNCTFTTNSGFFRFDNSPVNILNTIAWNNNQNNYEGTPGSVEYSCLQMPISGTGVINTNPFLLPTGYDYELQLSSPCIDAGNPDPSFNDRDNTRNDMGYKGGPLGDIYDYQAGPPLMESIEITPKLIMEGDELTIRTVIIDAQSSISHAVADILDINNLPVTSIELFDDGTHQDQAAGDHLFANRVSYAWTPGMRYIVNIIAEDSDGHTMTENNAGTFDCLYNPDTVNVFFTSEPIRINGIGDESIWNSIPAEPVTHNLFGIIDNEEDLSASFKACWNLDSLFVLVNVTDDSLDNVHGYQVWEMDKVGIYLDMDKSFGMTYDTDDWIISTGWENALLTNRGLNVRYVYHTNDARNGYQVEYAIPLKDAGFPLKDLIGFDLDVLDRDGEDGSMAVLYWNSHNGLNNEIPAVDGIARLVDYDAHVQDQIIKVLGIDFPSCGNATSAISAILTNLGSAAAENFEIKYAVNGTEYLPEIANITVNPGDTVLYTFTTLADLSVTGKYDITVTPLVGDPHFNWPLTASGNVFGTDPYANWTSYSSCNGLPSNEVRFVMNDSHNNIWIGTGTGGAARMDAQSGDWTVFNMENSGFTNNNAITLLEDHEGKIWVGLDGEDGIVTTYDGNSWTSNNPANRHVLTMFEDHENNMWFGTWGSGGVRKWNRNADTWLNYNVSNSDISDDDMWYGAIMEDTLNNMWFSTIDMGLNKFDGFTWTRYTTDNSNISGNSIWGSLMDRQGNIWMAHGFDFGVTKFDRQYIFDRYNTYNSGLVSNGIHVVFEDSRGNMWFGSWNQGVSMYNGTSWTTFNSSNSGLATDNVNSICEDKDGNLWFAGTGLYKYEVSKQALKVITLHNLTPCGNPNQQIAVTITNTGSLPVNQADIRYTINGNEVTETADLNLAPGDTTLFIFNTPADLSATGDYTILVTTLLNGGDPVTNQPYQVNQFIFGENNYEDWEVYSICNGLPQSGVSCVLIDNQKNIWTGDGNGNISKLNTADNSWNYYQVPSNVLDLMQDSKGNIWAALDVLGYAMFDGNSWTFWNDFTHVLSLFEDHSGNIWLGSWGSGVARLDPDSHQMEIFSTSNSGIAGNVVWNGGIMQDSEDNMWFGCLGGFGDTGGLCRFDGVNWTNWNTGNSGIPSNSVFASLLDKDGNIWVSFYWNQNGVARFDGTNWLTYNTGNSGLNSNSINSIYQDVEGNMWFGGNGANVLKNGTWEYFDIQNSGLTSNGLNEITGDKDFIWFGTNALCRYSLSRSHFQSVWTGNGYDHMNFYATLAKIDGTDMQPGDEIGIFDGDVCVGAGILTEVLNGSNYFEVRVSRDETGTGEIDGYQAGHQATFKLWDANRQMEIDNVTITYISGNDVFEPGATTWYQINGTGSKTQVIPFTNGWNIFSLNVVPENISMMEVMKPLIDEGSLVKVQSENGAAVEYISFLNTWINNIGNWSNTEGYKIRVNTNTNLEVYGVPVLLPLNIPLQTGWNIMSYPAQKAQDATDALTNLINSGHLSKVQNENGAAIEPLPFNMGWIDNIGTLEPGEGYKIRVTVDEVFTANEGNIEKTTSCYAVQKGNHFSPSWEGNGYDQMNIYIAVSGNNLKAGDEIAVFDGDVCAGSLLIDGAGTNVFSLIASSDDPLTPETDGFVKGDRIQFRIWKDGIEIINPEISYIEGYTDKFEPMGTTVTRLKVSGNDLSELGLAYPNPFSNVIHIPYSISSETEIELSVYNSMGQKVTTLVSGRVLPGVYEVDWDGRGMHNEKLNAGIYLIRLNASGNVMTQQIGITE